MGLHLQTRNTTQALIDSMESGALLVPGFIYYAVDTEVMYYAKKTNLLSDPLPGAGIIASVANSENVTLSVDTNGALLATVALVSSANNILESTAQGLQVLGYAVHPDSANLIEIDSQRRIRLKNLAISTTTTDTTSTSLAAALTAAGYPGGGDVFQESDSLILTAATGGTQIWIHNGGTTGDASDFTQIESPSIDASFIRSQLSSGNAAILYNPNSGEISLQISSTTGNDLTIDANGIFLDVSAASIIDSEGLLGSTGAAVQMQVLVNALAQATEASMRNFSIGADVGSSQEITDGEIAYIRGDGVLETITTSNTVTVRFDTSGVATGQVLRYNGTFFEWATLAVGTDNSFENGLTDTSGVVRLGGTLNATTEIALGSFAFSFSSGTGKSVAFPSTGDTRVQVDGGDMEVLDVGAGYLVRSPNGVRWRITIADDGSLTTTQA